MLMPTNLQHFHRFRGAWLLCMACLALPLPSTAQQVSTYAVPPLGDSYLAWTLHRMDTMVSEDDFVSDESLATGFLRDPTSIYSELATVLPGVTPTPRAWESWKYLRGDILRKRRETAIDDAELRKELAWDLGFTKARPGKHVLPDPTIPTPSHIYLDTAANVHKSGVPVDFLVRGMNLADHNGNLTTLGVELAASVQILREWAAAAPPGERRRLGIDIAVASRFAAATNLSDLSDSDLAYLAGILRSELSTWRAGRRTRTGDRELPTPFRLARAAMSHWTQSAPATLPCDAGGGAFNGHAGTVAEDLARPICTIDATDRAVYRRYRALREQQLHLPLASFHDPEQAERLIRIFGPIRPAWAGFFRTEALDYSSHAEVVEAQMAVEADDSPDSDVRFWRLVERANVLVCRSAAR
jgi:hypothetical protein